MQFGFFNVNGFFIFFLFLVPLPVGIVGIRFFVYTRGIFWDIFFVVLEGNITVNPDKIKLEWLQRDKDNFISTVACIKIYMYLVK